MEGGSEKAERVWDGEQYGKKKEFVTGDRKSILLKTGQWTV